MTAFQDANGIQFQASFINNHDEIQAKVKQNPGGYDLVLYYQGYHNLYRDLEVISPLDSALLPNYEKNYDQFKHQDWWEKDGELLGLPFTFGSWTLNYNPEEMEAPTAWTDLLDPKFKNRIAILDDPNGAVLIGGLILDLPVPRLSRAQLDQIIDFYRDVRENARTIAPSPGDLTNLFSSKEVVAVIPGYTAMNSFIAAAGVPTAFIIPDEGSASFCDAWALTPEAENRELAHAWMNHTLTPEIQAVQARDLSAGVVTPDAVPGLAPEQKELFPYDDLDGWLTKAPLYDIPPEDEEGIVTYKDWIDTWAAFKSESA